MTDDILISRVANMLQYIPEDEVCSVILEEGHYNVVDVFFAVKAARLLVGYKDVDLPG